MRTYLFALAALLTLSCSSEEIKKQPNILICVADDLSFAHYGAAGCTWINTPAMDKIATEGLRFENAYTPNAKCAPSRATILTGLYSWELEEAANHWCYFPSKFKTYAEVLGENGYHTGFTGKGWAPGDPGKSADGSRRKLLGKGYSSKQLIPPTKHISRTDYSENFKDFMKVKPADKPFCFWYGCNEPHRAYEFMSGVKVAGKKLEQIDEVPAFWPDVDSVRHDMLDYALETEYFDMHLGNIIATLDSMGELDNTLIIVTADNGMPFPRVKGQCYEFSNHLPLIVMWPERIKNSGRVIEDYVSFVDFAPTILDAAGIDYVSSGMTPSNGKSLGEYFSTSKEGMVNKERDYALIGKERHDIGRPNDWGYPIRGIRKGNYLYVYNYENSRWPSGNPETGYLNSDGGAVKSVLINGRTNPEIRPFWKLNLGFRPSEELYNVVEDPYCVNNIADKEEVMEIKAQLKVTMEEKLTAMNDPRMEGNGSIFEAFPLASEKFRNYYDKYKEGTQPNPRWIFPSDVDPAAKDEVNEYVE